MKSTKFARAGQYIGAITKFVSNAATFTQATIAGSENAKAIFRNAKSGKLLSIDTASNVVALGLNVFTAIVSGKGTVTSGKNIKKMIGTDVGNKWGNKANNKPLLEYNLQFFADKSGSPSNTLYHYTNEKGMNGIVESKKLNPSLKANNPNDCFYGEGQYLSDIVPGTKLPAQLSRSFIHNPFQGAKYAYYVEIDVTDLDVVYGRDNVFVILNQESLDLMDRIVFYGKVGD